MKPFLRSTSSSRHFKPTPARVVRLGIACAALLAGAGFVRAASCDTQCEPAAGSSEGFVSPTPGSETSWSGSVPSPTPTPTPGITGARAINFTDTGDNVVPDNQTVGWAFTVNSNQNENRPVTVTALGVWDGPSISPSPSPTPTPTAAPGDGLENEHQVMIWDSNGTPLVGRIVPAATAAPADD